MTDSKYFVVLVPLCIWELFCLETVSRMDYDKDQLINIWLTVYFALFHLIFVTRYFKDHHNNICVKNTYIFLQIVMVSWTFLAWGMNCNGSICQDFYFFRFVEIFIAYWRYTSVSKLIRGDRPIPQQNIVIVLPEDLPVNIPEPLATETITYQEESTQPCSICLTDFENGSECSKLECGHFFHRQCLEDWLKVKNTCPICRLGSEEV